MKSYIEYINSSCVGFKDNSITRAYKKKLIDDMTERANEITHAGIKDENVLTDIIIDEFGDLKDNYSKFAKEEKKRIRSKRFRVFFPIVSLIFLMAVLAIYFYVSSITGAWGKTWLIITGGTFLIVAVCSAFAINKLCHMRRLYHPFARILIAFSVMLITVYAFLFCNVILSVTAWPVILIGVIVSLIADLAFAYSTKQKFRTISFFLYVPAVAAITYVVLAAYGVLSWGTGWLIIILGVIADLVYLLAMSANNMKYFMYKKEAE